MSENKNDGYAEWDLIKSWRNRERKSVNEKQALFPARHDIIKEFKNYFLEDADELEQKLREIVAIHDLTEPQANNINNIIKTNVKSFQMVFDLIKSIEKENQR